MNKSSHHRKDELGTSAYFRSAAMGRMQKGITEERLSDSSERTDHPRRLTRLARELAASARKSALLNPLLNG